MAFCSATHTTPTQIASTILQGCRTLTSAILTQAGIHIKYHLSKLSASTLQRHNWASKELSSTLSWEPGQGGPQAVLDNTKEQALLWGLNWGILWDTGHLGWLMYIPRVMFLFMNLHDYCKTGQFFYLKIKSRSQQWWNTLSRPVFWRLLQEDCEFKASMRNATRPRPA